MSFGKGLKVKNHIFNIISGDEISGVSVSVREKDDIVTIWNTRSDLAEQCSIVQKIKELVPNVTFTAAFYKGTVDCDASQVKSLDCFCSFLTHYHMTQFLTSPN